MNVGATATDSHVRPTPVFEDRTITTRERSQIAEEKLAARRAGPGWGSPQASAELTSGGMFGPFNFRASYAGRVPQHLRAVTQVTEPRACGAHRCSEDWKSSPDGPLLIGPWQDLGDTPPGAPGRGPPAAPGARAGREIFPAPRGAPRGPRRAPRRAPQEAPKRAIFGPFFLSFCTSQGGYFPYREIGPPGAPRGPVPRGGKKVHIFLGI